MLVSSLLAKLDFLHPKANNIQSSFIQIGSTY